MTRQRIAGANRDNLAGTTAGLLASDATPAEKIAAIPTLEARGDADAQAILAPLVSDPDPDLAAAATTAIRAMAFNRQLWSVVQNIWFGLSLGSVLLLAAVGLAITFGVMGVINMAHGELVMIGA